MFIYALQIPFRINWEKKHVYANFSNTIYNVVQVILALKPTHVKDVQNQQQFQISQSKTEYRIEKYSNGSKRLVDISLDSVSNILIKVLG